MEKIIDKILSDLRFFTPKSFNDFCRDNNIDKSSRSAFKSSLENTIKELSSERDQIIIPKYKTEKFKRINPVTNWYSDMSEWDRGNPLKNYSTTFRTYPPGTDIKKAERDKKRKDELENKIFYLDEMLQIVNLYPEKETTQTKENDETISLDKEFNPFLKPEILDRLKKLNNEIKLQFDESIKVKKLKTYTAIQVNLIYAEYKELESQNSKNKKDKGDFYKLTFTELEFPFEWEKEQFVKLCYNY